MMVKTVQAASEKILEKALTREGLLTCALIYLLTFHGGAWIDAHGVKMKAEGEAAKTVASAVEKQTVLLQGLSQAEEQERGWRERLDVKQEAQSRALADICEILESLVQRSKNAPTPPSPT